MIQEIAVAAFLGFNVGQAKLGERIQAVAAAVFFAFHRRIAKLRASFHVEKEQEPVQIAQALRAEFVGFDDAVDFFPLDLAQKPDGLVAQDLDRFADVVLQALGDPSRFLVRLFR